MNTDDFKQLLDESLKPIKEDLNEVRKQLDNPESGLKRINEKMDTLWQQVVKVTEEQEEAKDILKSHTAQLKRIETKIDNTSENTEKLGSRLSEVEHHAGIVPPPEFTLLK